MIAEYANPKNAINLFAGLSSLFFEKVGGITPLEALPPSRDDLTRINGIGKTFAERLNKAGIHTFAQLAELSPEQIREVTAMKPWQADPDDWIVQAAVFATN